jgi:hypothetical protein
MAIVVKNRNESNKLRNEAVYFGSKMISKWKSMVVAINHIYTVWNGAHNQVIQGERTIGKHRLGLEILNDVSDLLARSSYDLEPNNMRRCEVASS